MTEATTTRLNTPGTNRFNVIEGKAFSYPLRRVLRDLTKDYVGTLEKIQNRYGPLVHWRLFGGILNFAFISDATVNRALFVQNGDALMKAPSQTQTFLFAAGPSVATAHGDDWRKKRKEANSLFSRSIIEASFAGQVEIVERFAKSLEPQPQDAIGLARRLAALTSSRGILGRDITLAEADIQIAFSKAAGDRFNAESAHLFARPNWMLAPWRRALTRHKREAFEIVRTAIKDLRRTRRPNDGLMAHFVNGDFVTSNDAEMETFLVGLLMGAQDNITAAVAWMIAFVSPDRDLQDQLRDEISAAGQDAQDLNACRLLLAVVAEVLRLRPPAPANQPRQLSQSIRIADHALPKGTYVFNSFYNMHHDEKVFEAPKDFDPKRFLNDALLRSPSFAPFGHGPRNCVARGMATQQLTAILAGLLRKHSLSTELQSVPETQQNPFLTPAPFLVSVLRR